MKDKKDASLLKTWVSPAGARSRHFLERGLLRPAASGVIARRFSSAVLLLLRLATILSSSKIICTFVSMSVRQIASVLVVVKNTTIALYK